MIDFAGDPGLPGIIGESGIKGELGVPGLAGLNGERGPKGLKGFGGIKGGVGPTGMFLVLFLHENICSMLLCLQYISGPIPEN